jgi:hypothetical protein
MIGVAILQLLNITPRRKHVGIERMHAAAIAGYLHVSYTTWRLRRMNTPRAERGKVQSYVNMWTTDRTCCVGNNNTGNQSAGSS